MNEKPGNPYLLGFVLGTAYGIVLSVIWVSFVMKCF